MREAVENAPAPDAMPDMASIDDCTAPGRAGPIPLRIYRPLSQMDQPVLVYFHGGGMVMGSNRSFELLARALAAGSGATVVAVDYRLAPEFPPPAQFDDARDATVWVSANAERLSVDPTRLCVVGDSAGGALAAAVALASRDDGGPTIYAQVLLYPGLDRDMSTASIADMPDAPLLTYDDICFMRELADTTTEVNDSPYRFPANASNLAGLPQAVVVTAECDPTRDWGERYAMRLREARVQVTLTRYPGIYHGFLMRPDATARGRLAISEVCSLLRAKFACPLTF